MQQNQPHPVLLRPVFIQRILCFSFQQPKISNLFTFASVCHAWSDTCENYSENAFFPLCCLPNSHLAVQKKFSALCEKWSDVRVNQFSDFYLRQADASDFFKKMLRMIVRAWVTHRKQQAGKIIKTLIENKRRTAIFGAIERTHEELVHFLLFELFEDYGGVKCINFDAELECSILLPNDLHQHYNNCHLNNTFEYMIKSQKFANTKIFSMFIRALQKFAESKELDPRRKHKTLKISKINRKFMNEYCQNGSFDAHRPIPRKHLWYETNRKSSPSHNIFEEPNLLYAVRMPQSRYQPVQVAPPLSMCILYNKLDFVPILLSEAKCNPNFFTHCSVVDKTRLQECMLPIHAVLSCTEPKSHEYFKMLLDAGATTDLENVDSDKLLSKNQKLTEGIVKTLTTIFHYGRVHNFVAMMRVVLESKALFHAEVPRMMAHIEEILVKVLEMFSTAVAPCDEKRNDLLTLMFEKIVLYCNSGGENQNQQQKMTRSDQDAFNQKFRCGVVRALAAGDLELDVLKLIEKFGFADRQFLKENAVAFIACACVPPTLYYLSQKKRHFPVIVDYILDQIKPEPESLLISLTDALSPIVGKHRVEGILRIHSYNYHTAPVSSTASILHHLARCCIAPANAAATANVIRKIINYVPKENGMREKFVNLRRDATGTSSTSSGAETTCSLSSSLSLYSEMIANRNNSSVLLHQSPVDNAFDTFQTQLNDQYAYGSKASQFGQYTEILNTFLFEFDAKIYEASAGGLKDYYMREKLMRK